jgi:hypothetical protein
MSFDLNNYVDVAERIRTFRERHPEGSLQPANIDHPYTIETIDGRTFIVYVACAYRSPDDTRPGIGCAWEPFPGLSPFVKNSELQNAETSAWGRAIVACLAADTQKIATVNDVRNRQAEQPQTKPAVAKPVVTKPNPIAGQMETATARGVNKAQKTYINKTATVVAERLGMTVDDLMINLCGVTVDELKGDSAQQVIQNLTKAKEHPESIIVDDQTGRVVVNG